jgi:hypothetical protein
VFPTFSECKTHAFQREALERRVKPSQFVLHCVRCHLRRIPSDPRALWRMNISSCLHAVLAIDGSLGVGCVVPQGRWPGGHGRIVAGRTGRPSRIAPERGRKGMPGRLDRRVVLLSQESLTKAACSA